MFLCRTTLKDNNLSAKLKLAKLNVPLPMLTYSYEFLLQSAVVPVKFMTSPKLYKVKKIAYGLLRDKSSRQT